MPRIAAACCAAGAALLAPALGIEDAVSLVQAASTKPSALYLSKKPLKGEAGSYVSMDFGTGCKSEECPFNWGDKLNVGVVAHLPSGIHMGDKVHSNLTIGIADDESSPLSALLSGGLKVDSSCDVCHGSCSIRGQSGEDWLSAVWPTILQTDTFCTPERTPAVNKQDFPLLTLPMQTPALPAGVPVLALAMTMGVQAEDGTTRAAASGKMASSGHKGSPLALLQLAQEHMRGPVSALKAAWDSFFPSAPEQAPSEAAEAEADAAPSALSLLEAFAEGTPPRHGGPGKVDSMVMNLKINHLEEGNKITLASEAGCKTGGSGSYDCRMEFGKAFSLTSSGRLGFDFAKGSRAKVKLSFKGGGLMSMMMKTAMQTSGLSQLDLPICGEQASITVLGKAMTLPAAECGYYEIAWGMPTRNLEMPPISALKLPAKLPGLSMPLPMTDLSKMQPMTLVAHVTILGPHGRQMADLEVESGFGR